MASSSRPRNGDGRLKRDRWFGVDQATNAIVGRMGCGGGAVVAVTVVRSLSDVV